jgi:hypothetical protein
VSLRPRTHRGAHQALYTCSLEVREVAALDEADKVGGGVDRRAVDELHRAVFSLPNQLVACPIGDLRLSRVSGSARMRKHP